jgi:hypothetical protein
MEVEVVFEVRLFKVEVKFNFLWQIITFMTDRFAVFKSLFVSYS